MAVRERCRRGKGKRPRRGGSKKKGKATVGGEKKKEGRNFRETLCGKKRKKIIHPATMKSTESGGKGKIRLIEDVEKKFSRKKVRQKAAVGICRKSWGGKRRNRKGRKKGATKKRKLS